MAKNKNLLGLEIGRRYRFSPAAGSAFHVTVTGRVVAVRQVTSNICNIDVDRAGGVVTINNISHSEWEML